jgi:hypothetical protein
MLKIPPAAALAALALLSPLSARAQEAESGLDMKYMYYWDRNGVWNHTPAFAFFKKISAAWKLQWNQEFDYVSGASRRLGLRNIGRLADHDLQLDGISGASQREMRHSEQATAAYADQGRTASASFYFSDENDYRSYSPSVSGSWDFNQRNTTVSGGLALFFDELSPRGSFSGLGGSRRIVSVNVGVTQLLTPLSLVSVTVQPIYSSGKLGHPYNPAFADSGRLLSEELPGHKLSAALTATWVQGFHLAGRLGSAHLEYRFYRDDWDLDSHTADIQWYQYLTETAWVRMRIRGYSQGAAGFAKTPYRGDEVYRSPDIRYFQFASATFGVKAGSAFPESWQDSPYLPDRWDLGYDHGIRDTKGELDGVHPYDHYQLFSPTKYYMQGTFMAGLGFDL